MEACIIEKTKLFFKKITGKLQKEEEERRSRERLNELEEVYVRIKEIPLTKWTLIKNEPNPFKKEMREMYERNRKSAAYCIFDDGSMGHFLEEYKYTFCANSKNVGVVLQTDGYCYHGSLVYGLDEAEPKQYYISKKSKISVLDKKFVDFIKNSQDIIDRDNIESKIMDFFGNLMKALIPMKRSDFFAGQKNLPLFMPVSVLNPA